MLARRLKALKVETAVMSPSKREHERQTRIKTDRRDAKAIAKLYRNGDIIEVRVPPALDSRAERDRLCAA